MIQGKVLIMKKKSILFSFSVIVTVLFFGAGAWAQPAVSIDDPVYRFDPVMEGSHVAHSFIVKNTGDSTLTILDVQPP